MSIIPRLRGILNQGQGTIGPWTPALLPEASIWLDANNSGSLELSGNVVVSWTDSYRGQQVMGQLVPAQRPTLVLDSQNGLPGVAFNGITQGLISSQPIGIVGDADFSVYVVYRKRTPTSGTVYGWGSLQVALGSMILFDNNQLSAYAFSGDNNYRIQSIPTQETLMQEIVKQAGPISTTTQAFRDGSDTGGTGHSAQTPDIISGPLRLGSFNNAAGFFLDGIVYELLVIPDNHGVGLRQIVEGYLAHKWGIADSLPADHPYKDSAP